MEQARLPTRRSGLSTSLWQRNLDLRQLLTWNDEQYRTTFRRLGYEARQASHLQHNARLLMESFRRRREVNGSHETPITSALLLCPLRSRAKVLHGAPSGMWSHVVPDVGEGSDRYEARQKIIDASATFRQIRGCWMVARPPVPALGRLWIHAFDSRTCYYVQGSRHRSMLTASSQSCQSCSELIAPSTRQIQSV